MLPANMLMKSSVPMQCGAPPCSYQHAREEQCAHARLVQGHVCPRVYWEEIGRLLPEIKPELISETMKQ